MKPRKSDRWIILFLVVALVIQVAWLLIDMEILSPSGQSRRSGAEGLVAGFVEKTQNKLKRRALNSLVWEASQESQPIYYHDSVLTLAQSSAVIQLQGKSQLKLSENTLVIIEPPESETTGEIKLKFIKGSLQARNAFAKSKIEHESFALQLNKGSVVELAQIDENSFDIQLKEGSGSLQADQMEESLSQGKIIQVQNGTAQSISIDKNLKWVDIPKARIFTRSDHTKVPLHWRGKAEQIVVVNREFDPRKIDIGSLSKIELSIPMGKNRLYLKQGDQISEPLDIEVWQAPLWHLVHPLPRDRAHIGPLEFYWTGVPQARSYKIKLKGLKSNKEWESTSPLSQYNFVDEDDYQWGIWVIDKDGFEIAPPYSYPLFIRQKPFQAPKTNKPKFQSPKAPPPPSALLWEFLFMGKAFAEGATYQAIFSWEPIEGADLYHLEISATPDFRNPVLKTQVRKSEFMWGGVKDQRDYYWRVAAGSSSGRMGIFSEPEKITLTLAPEAPVAKPKRMVKAKPKMEPLPIAKEANTKKATIFPPVTKPKLENSALIESSSPAREEDSLLGPVTYRFSWRAGYGSLKGAAERQVDTNLSGMKFLSFGFEFNYLSSIDRLWKLALELAQTEFKPTSKLAIPHQDNLSISQGEFRLIRYANDNHYGVGFIGKLAPAFERKSADQISSSSKILAGATFETRWQVGGGRYLGYLSPLAGSGLLGATMSHRWTRPIYYYFFLGIEFETDWLQGKDQSLTNFDGYLLMGAEF
ncbi:MAG: hypothetical protein KDD33_05415 [Bdellovibrionales bacterium]|nr:hypothetical protein [Bdellovibrionales bacterium]